MGDRLRPVHIQSDAKLTMTGDSVGTLRYMSPEQALAKRVPIDHRTDVYSLGATLYELLTLDPAFGGRDRQELLRQIAFEEPKPPRRIAKGVPAELEIIVLKAMSKNPADRYGTAQELADDLRRFLDDKPIRRAAVVAEDGGPVGATTPDGGDGGGVVPAGDVHCRGRQRGLADGRPSSPPARGRGQGPAGAGGGRAGTAAGQPLGQ